jgi:hypothetical protein
MRLKCDTGIQYALVRDRDPQALKRQVEHQIRAAEDRNKVFLENAARRDIDAFVNSTSYAIKAKPVMPLAQLSLNFDKVAVSARLPSATPLS